MHTATFKKYTLLFKRPSGTSRGVLKKKESWFIFLKNTENSSKIGIGECGLLKGLSIDDRPDFEEKLKKVCENPDAFFKNGLDEFPAIQFGLEMAFLDLQNGGKRAFFESAFLQNEQPIPINGLIWMGEKSFMFDQIKQKIEAGFRCIKLKIGAIDFEEEMALLKYIRQQFGPEEVELRVDANGAFAPNNALEKLENLAALHLHSIEQPIRQGQWPEMARLCEKTPLPIALDEELIGIFDTEKRAECLDVVKPQYIILKPSLVGGFASSNEWIQLAEDRNIGWWATSALESNIGLNAIAQWTATLKNPLPQGLGTGQLYTNNFESPLEVVGENLFYRNGKQWNLEPLFA